MSGDEDASLEAIFGSGGETDDFDAISRAHGVHPALVKASIDEFEYAVGLRDGTVINFASCEIDRDYMFVTLRGIRSCSITSSEFDRLFSFERGLEVRLVDILWAADAPFGS